MFLGASWYTDFNRLNVTDPAAVHPGTNEKRMPLYEYECLKCGERFEQIQKFSDLPLKQHPDCGGEVRKLLSAPAIQFKGSGWYITDYARAGKTDGKAEAKAEAKAEKTDKKTNGKSETKSSSGSDSGSTAVAKSSSTDS